MRGKARLSLLLRNGAQILNGSLAEESGEEFQVWEPCIPNGSCHLSTRPVRSGARPDTVPLSACSAGFLTLEPVEARDQCGVHCWRGVPRGRRMIPVPARSLRDTALGPARRVTGLGRQPPSVGMPSPPPQRAFGPGSWGAADRATLKRSIRRTSPTRGAGSTRKCFLLPAFAGRADHSDGSGRIRMSRHFMTSGCRVVIPLPAWTGLARSFSLIPWTCKAMNPRLYVSYTSSLTRSST